MDSARFSAKAGLVRGAMRFFRPGAVVVLALFLAACGGSSANQQTFQAWLDEEPRIVQLVVEPPATGGTFHVMETHYGAGAAAGAGAGAAGWFEAGSGMSGCTGEAGAFCLLLWLAMFPVLVLGGAVVGAATAEPVSVDSWALAEAELTRPIAPVFAEYLPGMTDRVGADLAAAFRDHGGHTVVLSVSAEPEPEAAEARIVIRLQGADVLGQAGENPKVRLRLRVYASATWPTGVEGRVYEYKSGKARLGEWSAEGATVLQGNFDEAAGFLTGRMVGRMLLPPPPPAGPGS